MRWLALTIACLLIGPAIEAAENQRKAITVKLRLAWDFPQSMAGIVGFKIYRGTNSGAYFQAYSVGLTNQTDIVVEYFAGETNYFVCVSVAGDGMESLPSNEVSWMPWQVLLWWKEPSASIYAAPSLLGPWEWLGTIKGTNLWLPRVTQEYFKANVRLNIKVR